jgi:hypothetical protein
MPYAVTTLATLQALMVQRWDTVVFWTTEEARLALNEALREWNLLTGRWRTRVTLTATGGVPEIALPSSMTYGMRVATASGWPLIPSSIAEFDLGRPSWRRETISSGGIVPGQPMIWAPVSLTQIAIWPALAVTTAAALSCDGVLATPILVNPTDTVDLGEEIIGVIVDFALHIAAFKEGAARWRATRPYFDTFLSAAAEKNALLKTHQAYRRFAGLDRTRDLQSAQSAPSQMQGVAAQFSAHDPNAGGA